MDDLEPGDAVAAPPAEPVPSSPDELSAWEQAVLDAASATQWDQSEFDSFALAWASLACLILVNEGGEPPVPDCDFIQAWLDRWREHAAMVVGAGGAVQCDYDGFFPVDFVPCWDRPFDATRSSACDYFKRYGCQLGTWIDPDSQRDYTGCWLPGNASAPVLHKPLQCAQRYLCAQTPDRRELEELGLNPERVHLDHGEFTRLLTATRDLKCGLSNEAEPTSANTWVPEAAEFLGNWDRNALAAGEMLRACVADLTDEPGDADATELLASAGCVDQARYLRALGSAGQVARDRAAGAGPPVPSNEDLAADALFLRLIQVWLDIHAYVARQGVQEDRLARVIRADRADPLLSRADEVPSLAELIEVEAAGRCCSTRARPSRWPTSTPACWRAPTTGAATGTCRATTRTPGCRCWPRTSSRSPRRSPWPTRWRPTSRSSSATSSWPSAAASPRCAPTRSPAPAPPSAARWPPTR
jgi:hypothetical protein